MVAGYEMLCLEVDMLYQNMPNKFSKSTIYNRNFLIYCNFFYDSFRNFIFQSLITTERRVLDPSNLILFWSKNFRCARLQHLLASQNSTHELLCLRRKFKKYEIFFYWRNTFFPFCFIKISSGERDKTLKISTLQIPKLSYPL